MSLMRRAGRRPTGAVKAATGERIVAFGRAGKPPENSFFRHFSTRSVAPRIAEMARYSSTEFKAAWRRSVIRGISDMAFGTKKRESRKSVHQAGWITLEGGFAARQCMVQDLSTSGAKVTIEDSFRESLSVRLGNVCVDKTTLSAA